MIAAIYIGLLVQCAALLHRRSPLLKTFPGLPGLLFCLGLSLFGAALINLGLYVLFGWGWRQTLGSLVPPVLACTWGLMTRLKREPDLNQSKPRPYGAWAFAILASLLILRFSFSIFHHSDNNIWANFNFVDTAFHLSVANAFLESPRFPPIDLDLAPSHLRYHFLADFMVAHLDQLGAPTLLAMRSMNVLSAAALAGALWSTLYRWLGRRSGWALLAALFFLGISPMLPNLIHYNVFESPFFRPNTPISGILFYPYFNFEYALGAMFDPQRGLVFSFPPLLLVLHIACALRRRISRGKIGPELLAFWTVCLMPFGHIVGFTISALVLVPTLWRRRRAFASRWLIWSPALVLGLLQLYYLLGHGSEVSPDYSAWDAETYIAEEDFHSLPTWLQWPAFWFFVNGDFFFWGLLALLLTACTRALRQLQIDLRPARRFVANWMPLLAVGGSAFLFINLFRYSHDWGDSNKFVLFLNLGLSLVIMRVGASLKTGVGRIAAVALATLLTVLSLTRPIYELSRDLIFERPGRLLLFHQHEMAAADWLRLHRRPNEVVLTAARRIFHFVTPLAAAPTRSGIYGDTNPNQKPEVPKAVRQVYEGNNLAALRELEVRYICISRAERKRYKIHPEWLRRYAERDSLVFTAGGPDEFEAVWIFDTWRILGRP